MYLKAVSIIPWIFDKNLQNYLKLKSNQSIFYLNPNIMIIFWTPHERARKAPKKICFCFDKTNTISKVLANFLF